MRDTWIIGLTALLMTAVLLTGRFLRGDFTRHTAAVPSIATSLDDWAVEQGGIALININKADAETLTRLDGIGRVLSERIVAYREEYGPFSSLDELIKVDGIGTKTLERSRSRLVCLP